ncbi:MAG: biotin/lipoyl-binding protein [Fusobacteriales bacterium]|jgi:multidrug resistance efflux pump|nr:biotin/lipoyl-binding protein [Fusobacteriales bacterium]
MEPAKSKKSGINRVEIIAEDRTKYFGEISQQTERKYTEPEAEKADLNINIPKNLNSPLTMGKKDIDDYQRRNHQEYKGDIRKLLFAVLFFLIAGAAGSGIYYFRDKISISMPEFTKAGIKEIKGTVLGDERTVTSQINGRITEMNLEKGTPVKQGELLIALENPEYRIELDKAEKELRGALTRNGYTEVTTEEVKAVPVTTKKTAVPASGKKTYSKKIFAAEEKFKNDREAYNAGLISKVEYEQSLAEINRAREREKNAPPAVVTETRIINTKVAGKKSIPVEKKKVLDSAEVLTAIEKYKEAYINYKSTKIFAVNSGVITELYVTQGQDVISGQELFKTVNSSYLYTDVMISDKELGKAGIGSIADLISSVDNKEYEGVIISTKLIPEKSVNSVRIAVNNKGKNTLISVGSYVNIKVTKKKASQDLTESLKNSQQESKKNVLTAVKEEADKKVQEIIGEILK